MGNKMAAKKRKKTTKRRSYRPKAKRSRKPSPWNIAAAVGGAMTAVNIAAGRRGGSNNSPIDIMRTKQFSIQGRLQSAMAAGVQNAMVPSNWYPAIGGAAISAAPKIPIVKAIARPLSNQVKKVSHNKAVL
jgi:hypothetical protein